MNNDKEEKRSLEENFSLLEEKLKALEDEELPLEEAFGIYKEGMELLKLCNDDIDKVEKKVLMLREDGKCDEF
ncbi:MAG: exodeoxyribonuclease VII small subunit [Lachnospiraceae bacterium]|nr:exodeoxyribonuclease VII small subunit [Lachnospiraceae bacterium]